MAILRASVTIRRAIARPTRVSIHDLSTLFIYLFKYQRKNFFLKKQKQIFCQFSIKYEYKYNYIQLITSTTQDRKLF